MFGHKTSLSKSEIVRSMEYDSQHYKKDQKLWTWC